VFGPFPAARPRGLARRSLPGGTELWRIDVNDPEGWGWAGFPVPRHRFDPASGAFRTRYASTSIPAAARERYLDTGRVVPLDHADHHLVHLVATKPLRILDLRTQANLDALDVDDRINTSHDAVVWDACHRLADSVRLWWAELDGILFRSRTTPQTSVNLVFFGIDGVLIDARPLHTCGDELDDLILRHQFTIEFAY
jgi:RES domain